MTKAERYTIVAEALRDFRTYSHMNQVFIDAHSFCESIGEQITFGYYNVASGGEYLSVAAYGAWKIDYDVLIQQEGVCLTYGNSIEVNKEFVSVLPSGLEVKCIKRVEAKIPDEDMLMLEVIGKVERTITPASVSISVFCPTGMSQPLPF